MPVARAVLDIEVNDTELKAALATFEKIQKTISKTPGMGGGSAPGVRPPPMNIPGGGAAPRVPGGGGGGGGGHSPAVQQAMNVFILMNSVDKKQNEVNKKATAFATASKHAAAAWSGIKKDAASFGSHIGNASKAALSFASRLGITSAIGGVIGLGGSLWGLDRLAASASSGRRSSSGLGMSYGQQQAFGVTYGRLIDAGGFAGAINQGRGNVAGPQAGAMFALQMDPARYGNTADASTEAIRRIWQLTQRTPKHMLGSLMQTHRLGDLNLQYEDLERLRKTPYGDISQFESDFKKRSGQFEVSDKQLKNWQDLNVALLAAGQKIHSVLIDGLAPLAKPITQLSEGFSEMVRSLLGSQGFKDLLQSATEGLKDFAHYVSGPQFKDDVMTLVRSVGDLARFFGRLMGTSGGGASGVSSSPMTFEEYRKKAFDAPQNAGKMNDPAAERAVRDYYQKYVQQFGQTPASAYGNGGGNFGQMLGPAGIGTNPVNNPGNLRPVGQSTGFMQYATPQQGLQAMAKNLLYYQDKLGKNTIRDIVSTWAPSSENDTRGYIRNVSNFMGTGPDQKLNLNDTNTMANLMSAMIRMEGNGKNPNYQRPVIIEVLNNTGGNAIVQTNQMGSAAK